MNNRYLALIAVLAFIFLPLQETKAQQLARLTADSSNITALQNDTPQSLDTGTRSIDLPPVISQHDARLYHKIFKLQEDGKLTQADALIEKIDNNLLMGHVLYQRYMHPTAYRSKYSELKSWLEKYHDHPDATRIYKLARKRGSRHGLKYPTKTKPFDHTAHIPPSSGWLRGGKYHHLPLSKRYQAYSIFRKFRRYMLRGWTKAAKQLLHQKQTKQLLTPHDYDKLAGYLGFHYFLDKRDNWAFDWASAAADRSGDSIAQWAAGLAAWRLKNYSLAARYFEALGNNSETSSWMVSAGAYWASRSNIRNHTPQKANDWLEKAATKPHTFYGILARHTLGLPPVYNWDFVAYDTQGLESIMQHPNGKRAIALLQADLHENAEDELRGILGILDETGRNTLLAIAENHGLPALSLKLAAISSDHEISDRATYPLPDWTPADGWKLDKALIYAFVRQESQFDTTAKSHAGAQGLMQLMPRTAAHVARNRRLRWNRTPLNDPAYNLSLGQKYLNQLMDVSYISNNLFFMATAYNGGPGNLRQWQHSMDYNNDPLLFIESLPSRETRIYIERVLTNLWIYRSRLDQPVPSLDTLARGQWPSYNNLDVKAHKSTNIR